MLILYMKYFFHSDPKIEFDYNLSTFVVPDDIFNNSEYFIVFRLFVPSRTFFHSFIQFHKYKKDYFLKPIIYISSKATQTTIAWIYLFPYVHKMWKAKSVQIQTIRWYNHSKSNLFFHCHVKYFKIWPCINMTSKCSIHCNM